ncbi:DUF2510 domain-containing protein [Glaciihabitans sp. GrIS 2.15]|uniref:DUF2510 domain-containing protein n=1 Tax=Glaciihabitans sp. GrIS 2.15 TaxID=3071710 RepID=UPI002DFC2378|nr:hypothetical protein [Glaciihabitans sp. GrIS 2.15]
MPSLSADSTPVTEAAVEPLATLIVPGWYADPMRSTRSRWWNGTAWTAELGGETPVEPVADGATAVLAETAVTAPAAALSRRQLRELVGPLTTGPVLIDEPVGSSLAPSPIGLPDVPDHVPVVEPLPAAVPGNTDDRSPFEALFESSPAERESAEMTVFSATAFLDPTDVSDSTDVSDASVARPWIGAAAPLVPAASVSVPAQVQPAPTGPPAALAAPGLEPFGAPVSTTPPEALPVLLPSPAPTFSRGALGFRLPPDPFATSSTPVAATALPVVFHSPAAAVPGPVLAISERSTTAAVWILALLPVVHAAAVWLVLGLLDLGGSPVIRYLVLGAPLLLSPMLAFLDRRVLRGRGFPRTAPAALALVPPLYLLVRAIRVGAAGVVPLLLWLLLQTAAISFIVLQLPSVFALVSLTAPVAATPAVVSGGPITGAQRAAELTPSGMAAELTRQTLAKKLTFSSISCPPLPVTLDGTAVSCVGTLASVKVTLNVVIDSTLPNSAFALVSEAPTV